MDRDDKIGCGCYIVASYLLYWPAVWAFRAGAERYAEVSGTHVEFGEFGFYFIMWFIAPVSIIGMLLGVFCMWVLEPTIEFMSHYLW